MEYTSWGLHIKYNIYCFKAAQTVRAYTAYIISLPSGFVNQIFSVFTYLQNLTLHNKSCVQIALKRFSHRFNNIVHNAKVCEILKNSLDLLQKDGKIYLALKQREC